MKGYSTSPYFEDGITDKISDEKYKKILEDIFQFASSEYEIEIKDEETLKNAIHANANELFSVKSELTISSLNNQSAGVGSLKRKMKKLKKQLVNDEQTISEQETTILDLQTKNQELDMIIQEQKLKISQLSETKSKSDIPEEQQKNESMSHDILEPLQIFEQVLTKQSEDLSNYHAQRSILVSTLTHVDSVLLSLKDSCQILQEQNLEYQKQINSLQESQSSEDQIVSLANEIHELIINRIPLDEQTFQSNPRQFILNLISSLLDQQKNTKTNDKFFDEKYKIVLSHLESTIKFLQGNIEINQKSLSMDQNSKTAMITQCATINHFIQESLSEMNEKALPKIDTVFDESPEKQLSSFFTIVSEEQINESPIRELYALFSGIVEVNRYLMLYLNEAKERIKEINLEGVNSIQMKVIQNNYEDLQKVLSQRDDEISNALSLFPSDDTKYQNLSISDSVKQLMKDFNSTKEDLIRAKIERDQQIHLAADLQEKSNQMNDLDNDKQKEICSIRNELENKQNEITKLTEEKEKLLKENNEKQNIIEKTKEEYELTLKTVEEIQNRADIIVQKNEQYKHQIEEMDNVISQQNSNIQDLSQALRSIHKSKEIIKEKLTASETKNKTTLADIQKRHSDLHQKYDQSLKSFEEQINQLQNQLHSIDNEKKVLISKNVELSNNLQKIKINEKTLQVKLLAIQEKQSIERSANEAKTSSYVMSIKSQADQQIEEYKKQINSIKMTLLLILNQNFKIILPSSTPVDKIISQLMLKSKMNALDQKILDDAKKIREINEIPANSSLLTFIHQNEFLKHEMQEKLNKAEIELQKTKNVRNTINVLEKQSKEAEKWNLWGNSLLKQLQNTSTEDQNEIRKQLGNAILISIGHKSIQRTIETLRAEKAILSNQNPLPSQPNHNKKNSLIPIKALFDIGIFIASIQKSSGIGQKDIHFSK